MFSRDVVDMTKRLAMFRGKVLSLPASSAIIDAALVACDSDGKLDFNALRSVRTSAPGASICSNWAVAICVTCRSSSARPRCVIC